MSRPEPGRLKGSIRRESRSESSPMAEHCLSSVLWKGRCNQPKHECTYQCPLRCMQSKKCGKELYTCSRAIPRSMAAVLIYRFLLKYILHELKGHVLFFFQQVFSYTAPQNLLSRRLIQLTLQAVLGLTSPPPETEITAAALSCSGTVGMFPHRILAVCISPQSIPPPAWCCRFPSNIRYRFFSPTPRLFCLSAARLTFTGKCVIMNSILPYCRKLSDETWTT